MFTSRTIKRITINTEELFSKIYKYTGIEYTKKMLRIEKDLGYHTVELEFTDTIKAHALYLDLENHSTKRLTLDEVGGILTPIVGIGKSIDFTATVQKQLKALTNILEILGAEDEHDANEITVMYQLLGNNLGARITLRFRCDELVLF